MKKTNKKGFTLVELVIVIAVIAILAAVLIPTFATVIEKGKKSSRLQTAQNALKMALAEEDDASIPANSYIEVKADGKTVYFVYDGSKLSDEKSASGVTLTANAYHYSNAGTTRTAEISSKYYYVNIKVEDMANNVTVYVNAAKEATSDITQAS